MNTLVPQKPVFFFVVVVFSFLIFVGTGSFPEIEKKKGLIAIAHNIFTDVVVNFHFTISIVYL